MEDRPHLRRLADRVGILPSYLDVEGARRFATDSTRELLLAAMGLEASTEAAAEHTLADLDRSEQRRILPPVRVVRSQGIRPPRVPFRIPGQEHGPVEWNLELCQEDGATHTVHGRSRPRRRDRLVGASLSANPPPGYHALRLALFLPDGVLKADQALIVSPGRCTLYSERVGDRRAYGLWANLYSVRSRRNWGGGDLADLGEIARAAAGHGASFVGINPLHALRNRGNWIGPYCPVSRLYRNFLYLDVEAVPEFAECREAQERFESPEFQERLTRVRGTSQVDYERVAALKIEILRLLHSDFVEKSARAASDRGRAYAEYLKARGRALVDFATFMALDAWLTAGRPNNTGYRDWPAEFRIPDSPAVESFRVEHRRDVDFHCYLQFELDRQLGDLAKAVECAGMGIGLYPDLALGSAADGSDAWAHPGLFLAGVRVGAPPDPYSKSGQTWGFPPVDPRGLRASRYDYWIQLMRASLAHAGMLRIDHIMGLFRQYWVPKGLPATDGAYVRYPADDLLGILALESQRHRAVIVGEDLGTVPRGLPSILASWGILSSRVLYFERRRRGSFNRAASYSGRALVTATTHDHPPLAGFWAGSDLQLRREVGLFRSDEDLRYAQAERERTRAAFLRRLVAEGLGGEIERGSWEGLCRAVHAFLARTPCPLIGVSLDDLAGESDPVNLPGVELTQYPSWSRRMGRCINDILADPVVRRMLEDLRAAITRRS